MVDTIKMWSEKLQSEIRLKVIIPEQPSYKLMILLHGRMNPELSVGLHELFVQELGLEKLSNEYGTLIVIPLMPNRYYISTQNYDCNQFVAQELPDFIVKRYGITESMQRILAGVSMGGFGATLIGANTGAFQYIIPVSGDYIAHDVEIGNPQVWENLTPDSKEIKASYLYHFLPIENLEKDPERNAMAALQLFKDDRTVIVASCGTKDERYSRNLKYKREMENNKLNYKFFALEDGEHDAMCFKAGLWKGMNYLNDLIEGK